MSRVANHDWDLPEPFWIEVNVQRSDLDRLGHVNNSVYLQWCERTAWEHAESVGLGWEAWQRLDRAMAVRTARLAFLKATAADERLQVGNWLVKNDGRLRATRRFQILRAEDGVTLFRGEIDYVCIEISSGRPRRLPEEFVVTYAVPPAVATALEGAPLVASD